MTMRKCRKPKPRKPPRQEFRPYAGSTIRVIVEHGAPVPRFIREMIVKSKGA
jgi:hypothetical protein